MASTSPQVSPSDQGTGIFSTWRQDIIAALSVAMVAMPLGLGIAQASGLPPVSGLISAVIAGLVTTFLRGSHVAINGPGAGLIAVVFAAVTALDDGSDRVFNYVMAVFVVSGAIQMLMGLLKWGKIGELFPSAVIHGVLAAIGIIILIKQIPVALGTEATASDSVGILREIPQLLQQIHPLFLIISVLGLGFLMVYSRLKTRTIQLIPAPMWVLFLGIGLVYLFEAIPSTTLFLFGEVMPEAPKYFIDIPDDLLASLIFPDFSRIGEGAFWLAVIPVTLIGTIETLASAKAVDKLDPARRQTNLNRELLGVGAGTILSGMIGGMPVLTVIVRSSVNIQNRGLNRASNFFHGLILLVFLVVLTPVIQEVPLAALAAILLYTGYKLASPNMFRQAARTGAEQVMVILVTLVTTVVVGLLWGLFAGTLFTLFIHWLRVGLPLSTFFSYLRRAQFQRQQREDQGIQYRVEGILNFLNYLSLLYRIREDAATAHIQLDLSRARLVDLTALESFYSEDRRLEKQGGSLEIKGLEAHQRTARHPHALQVLQTDLKKPFTRRQTHLEQLATEKGWSYLRDMDWEVSSLNGFQFFESRPIEYKENVLSSQDPSLGLAWEIADVTFDEGALVATEVFHTTLEVVTLPSEIPSFTLSREGRLDKIFERVWKFAGYVDINFAHHPDFSRKYLLEAEDSSAVRKLFSEAVLQFLEEEEIYHIESNGSALLLFRRLRLAKPEEIAHMVSFCQQLVTILLPAPKD